MGLIQEGDYTISYEGVSATVYHLPTKTEIFKNECDNRFGNLKLALTELENKLLKIIRSE